MSEQAQLDPWSAAVVATGMPRYDRCALGEGLFLGRDQVAWVDITRNQLHILNYSGYKAFDLPVKATLILAGSVNRLLVASISGLGWVDIVTGTYREETRFDAIFCPETHRTNDGCLLSDGRYLVGTMHHSAPELFAGSVFLIDANEKPILVCDDIHIPNTFIELENGDILITDSRRGTIFRLRLSESGRLRRRSVWYQSQEGVSPDGGCRLSDTHLAVAMWDGACIRIFENSGKFVVDLAVPAKRPTNVKYDSDRCILWVTSASEGLASADLARYPLSGKTFPLVDPMALL